MRPTALLHHVTTTTKFLLFAVLAFALGLLSGCTPPADKSGPKPEEVTKTAATNAAPTIYQVKGEIVEIKPSGKTAIIKHEEIKGYMPAMTMPLDVKDARELADVKPGDKVSFRMLVTETDGWIDQVAVTESADPAKSKIKPTTRLVRDVEILKIGDKIPNYPFTNELGRAFTLKEFEGKALAITFIFTRCPFPTFCPLMNENFKKTYTSLKADKQAPANWHLLSLSFDPEYDTPATMQKYAQRYSYDTNHWSFATGALVEIDAITEQFGMVFSRQPGAFNFDHNLRTVVLDTRGRVHQIFIGNSWTPAELAEQLTQAAKIPVEGK